MKASLSSTGFSPSPVSLDSVGVRYLHAGDVIAVSEPALITTVLGSCVSICLWDSASGVAGINHFSMPRRRPGEASSLRFGEDAIPALISRMEAEGARREALVAGVFGGTVSLGAINISMGRENVRLAYEMMRDYGIPVIDAAVGGNAGRRIEFNTHSGFVRVEALRPISSQSMANTHANIRQ